MSDDEEYEYDYGSDADNCGSEGEAEGDAGADEQIEIENAFYEGDDLIHEDPQKALKMFEKVVSLESSRGDEVKWRFKALKNLVSITHNLGLHQEMVKKYSEMLTYVAAVTRNECTDAINSILDAIPASTNVQILAQMYELTLLALRSANNERLWFNTKLKLAKLALDAGNTQEIDRILTELKNSCQNPDGSDDISKGSYLLEVYCLEIQLCSLTHNASRMRAVYPKTLRLNSAVADPRIMGVIREEGGKMQMAESNWDEAYNEFFEAFRNYQESGNARAKTCLKYVVLASILALSDINPFAAREARVFADDKEILAMSDLRQCLEANDLDRFERTVKNKQNRIMEEPLLMTYIQPLRSRMREQALLNLSKPYQKVTLSFLAAELTLEVADVEKMLVDLIVAGRLVGHIDQIKGHLLLQGADSQVTAKTTTLQSPATVTATNLATLQALTMWANTLNRATESISTRVQ